jgi:hypothetical protein
MYNMQLYYIKIILLELLVIEYILLFGIIFSRHRDRFELSDLCFQSSGGH